MPRKEDPRLQGLCIECTHRNSCPDAKRHLNMIGCSEYKHWKKGYSKNHCASEERNLISSHPNRVLFKEATMRKVTVVKYDSKIRGNYFTDIIGVYSSRKKANNAILKLMLYVEEDLCDKKIGYTYYHESDKVRGRIVTDEGSEYLYYCVDYPFDALETVNGIEPL